MTLREKARALYSKPLLDLIFEAQTELRAVHTTPGIERCFLLSIKTGGCPEDCAYCSQSAHHKTGVRREPLLPIEQVRASIAQAREAGARRFCMGAAWREAPLGESFDRVLEMVREIKGAGFEVCATLGMITAEQAARLKAAGLDAYSHNLDTSREFYPRIVTTRTYDDRLQTIHRVREAGITLCSGGILGLGESVEDRCGLLAELASLDPPPESVPINLLMAGEGTPLEEAPPPNPLDLIRTIAVARILMPHSRVRLAAGRVFLSRETQILAFLAGANSVFAGEKLLTSPNAIPGTDEGLFAALGE
jgi:biotin synthase